MKRIMLIVGVTGCLLTGCATQKDTVMVITPKGKIKVPAYYIGAYTPDESKYGFANYNDKATREFLDSILNSYASGEIVAVDNLKWQRGSYGWEPYPNPPTPKLEPGEDRGKHCQEYAEWIDQHPHFGFPPLPLPNKK